VAEYVFQNHHLSYKPEIVVRIRKGVHNVCGLVLRHSKGMTSTEKRAIRCALEMIPDIEADDGTDN